MPEGRTPKGPPAWPRNDRGLATGYTAWAWPVRIPAPPWSPGQAEPPDKGRAPPHLPAHRRSHSLRSLGDLGLPQLLLSTLPLTGRGDPGDSTDFVAEDKESPVAPPSPTTPLRQKNCPWSWQTGATQVRVARAHTSRPFARAGLGECVLPRSVVHGGPGPCGHTGGQQCGRMQPPMVSRARQSRVLRKPSPPPVFSHWFCVTEK